MRAHALAFILFSLFCFSAESYSRLVKGIDGNRQSRSTSNHFRNVIVHFGNSVWYLYPWLSPYVQSCDTYQSYTRGSFLQTLQNYCDYLKGTCTKTQSGYLNSDCFVRETSVAIEKTCCQGFSVLTTSTRSTLRSTTLSTTTTTRTTTSASTTTPPSRGCGRSLNQRIVGGTNTTECEFPWIVGIRRNGNFICGGSIVNPNKVITAAHCVRLDAFYTVEVGKWRTHSSLDIYWEEITVKSKVLHPSFDPIALTSDIAVLTLDRSLDFYFCAQPICLPAPGLFYPPTPKCLVAGWGTIRVSGPQPTVLQKVQLTVYSSNECKVEFDGNIIESVFCAANDKEGGKDACQGDSGGPLMCLVNNVYTLFGIVSSGSGCASPGQAGYYTDVAYFRSWIDPQL